MIRGLFIFGALVLALAVVLSIAHGHWFEAAYLTLLLAGLPVLYQAATYKGPSA